MFNAEKPDPSELPSTSRLLKSTGIAAAVAAVLLVVVVMPAEYGKDPTGIGGVLGLTEMGRIKMSLAAEAAADAEANAAQPAPEPVQTAEAPTGETHSHGDGEPHSHGPAEEELAATSMEERTVALAPDEAVEIKLAMEEGDTVDYVWFTDGPIANYDLHGDRPGLDYFNYSKGREARVEGQLVADFTGSHGWFWRNRAGEPLTITLQVDGTFSDVIIYD